MLMTYDVKIYVDGKFYIKPVQYGLVASQIYVTLLELCAL